MHRGLRFFSTEKREKIVFVGSLVRWGRDERCNWGAWGKKSRDFRGREISSR